MDNNRNFILAILLSAIVLFGWQYMIAIPKMEAQQARQAEIARHTKKPQGAAITPSQAPGPVLAQAAPKPMSRNQALQFGGPRVRILTPTVDGSLRLKGARFDDLRLRKYHETTDPKSPEIDLLAPSGSPYPYFAQVGWSAADGKTAVPDENTPWQLVSGTVLAPGKPVVLTWDNGHGLVFTRKITVDDKYMFAVTDSVNNKSSTKQTLYPYALVVRDGVPERQSYWVLHEGFVGVADGRLKDPTYKDFKKDDKGPESFASTGGWLGVTDKYWMAALLPPQNEKYNGTFRATPFGADKSYQANYTLSGRDLAPGTTATVTHRMFAGAKVVDTLRAYQRDLGISRFDLAVDWGWFIFLTQPLFWLLDNLYRYLGNFGLAIIVATVLIRLVLFPLANASFKSMIKMKKVQPEMERIKKACEGDQQRQQQEMMELYKREKVNPVSGCLPMLIQIPILFSLYKVMFVTIEMYHAPFYGWIKDLSASDPTSYLNLFGLLPFTVPHHLPMGLNFLVFLLQVGIWPVLMGITQWVQTKMNPAPADPVQAKMFGWMPWIFMFMMAAFPAGLVIYWTWNNMLSVGQQYLMMRRENVPVHLFDNLRAHALVRWLTGNKPTEGA
jgi:YidC/Oxa1 family membrane protein insertase